MSVTQLYNQWRRTRLTESQTHPQHPKDDDLKDHTHLAYFV